MYNRQLEFSLFQDHFAIFTKNRERPERTCMITLLSPATEGWESCKPPGLVCPKEGGIKVDVSSFYVNVSIT